MKTVQQMLIILTLFSFMILPEYTIARTESDIVLPPDILPVVILSGNNYQMGYQYGQQAGHLIEKRKEAAWAEALVRYSRETILQSLKINQYYIKEYTPENIDIMKGIADGASDAGYQLTYTDVVLMNCTLPKPQTSTYPDSIEYDELPPKKCSVASAWGTTTKSGKLLGMDTLDGGEAYYGVIIIAYPEKGNHYMCGAIAGSIGSHFLMNNKGLFIGNSGGGGSHRDIDKNYGISWFCGLPHIARFANNAIQARDMITSWQIDIEENFHFVDVYGNAFVVEKTAALQSIRKSGDFGEKDFMFSTNNYLNEKMKVTKKGDFIKEHGGYGTYSAPRNLMLWDMLNQYQGQVDVKFMKMILRFPGAPPPYPPPAGWDAKICRPSNSWVAVLEPADGDQGVAHICTGPAGRIIHSSRAWNDRPMRSNYPYLNGTHTFYQLSLGKNPPEVAKKSRFNAKDGLATAYEAMMRLNFRDEGYASLNEIYNLAVEEYYLGHSELHKAVSAADKEKTFLYARAITYYSRSQAHSAQVFEALVPAPTSPTDLGLRAFGGNWATWETEVGESE